MDKLPADRPADVELDEPETLAAGFREYRRYHLTLRAPGHAPLHQQRDILIGGKVIAVLPVDLARSEVVLIRQFRLPAHLGIGKGDMVADEGERIETIRLPIDDAVALVQSGGVANGPLILALQWLALNRTRLDELLKD